MNYCPKISIITPSFNQGKYLEQTILSIINQKYPNLEYIIIDGGSTDNSVEIIKKYEKHLSYWVSERDKGQSDAINKGLKRVTGELFNWINSDDFMEEGALFKIAETYRDYPDKLVFCFGLNFLKDNKKERFKLQNNPKDKLQCFCDPVISQPATFFSSNVIRKIGELNPQLHFSMDYEWWLKCMFLYGEEGMLVHKETIASFRIHEKTKTSGGNENFVNDMANILYSLSCKAGLEKYQDILNKIFTINPQYEFTLPSEKTDKILIDRMVIYFLLKWKRNIYVKKDLMDVKNILKKIDFKNIDLSEKEGAWLDTMKENSSPASWLQYRAKRKIQHLFYR